MFATGIPPDIVLSNELVKIAEKLELLDENIFRKTRLAATKDQRLFARKLSDQWCNPITHSEVKDMIDDLKQSLLGHLVISTQEEF